MRDLNPRPPDPKSGVLPNWTNPQYAYVGFSVCCGFTTLVLTDSLLRYESYTTYEHFRSMPICSDLGKHFRDFIYTCCSNPRVVAHSVVNGTQETCTLELGDCRYLVFPMYLRHPADTLEEMVCRPLPDISLHGILFGTYYRRIYCPLAFSWSGIGDSNPRRLLGRQECYHYTNPA